MDFMKKTIIKLINQIKFIKGSKLTISTIFSFLIKISATVLTLGSTVLIARVLGPEQFGFYSFSISIISLLTVPTVLGLPNLIIRHIAAYQEVGNWALLKGLLVRVHQIIIAMIGISLLFTFLVIFVFADHINSLDWNTFTISLILLPLLAYNSIRSAILRGLNYVILSQLPENLIRHSLIIIIVIFVYVDWVSIDIKSADAMVINVLATGVTFVVGLILLKWKRPDNLTQYTPEYKTKEWIYSTIPLLIAGGMQVINKRTDIIILGIFTTPENVGIYNVVSRGAELVTFSLIAVNIVIAPKISKLYIKKSMYKLQKLIYYSNLGMILLALPTALIFMFFGNQILLIVFGEHYQSGSIALAILAFGHLISVGLGSVGLILNMTGHENDTARGVVISAVLNVILNLLFIPLLGIEGAALATSISLITWNILLCYWVYKRLNITPSIVLKINKQKMHQKIKN